VYGKLIPLEVTCIIEVSTLQHIRKPWSPFCHQLYCDATKLIQLMPAVQVILYFLLG